LANDFASFQEICDSRKKIFSTYNINELDYVLNRLADGESIDPFKLKTANLKELLVILKEIENAIEKVSNDIQASLTNRGYSFVIGDYGTGKTQLRELLIDQCSKELKNLITIKSDLGLASFGSFALELAQEIKKFTQTNFPEIYESIKTELTALGKTTEDSEIYRQIVQILKILTKNNIITFLNFDEVDMLPNFEAFTPWANFLVMVNQHIEAGVHIAFYMAPRDINRLWEKDTRLNRFNRYINNAILPGKTFDEKLIYAIAQIIAMYEVVNQIQISNHNKEIIFLYYLLYYESLKKKSVRKINTDFYQITEFFANLASKESWKTLLPTIEKLDDTQTQAFEHGFLEVLGEFLLEFELFDNNYKLTFDKREKELVIAKEIDQNYITLVKVPCVVAYAKGKLYDPNLMQFNYFGNEKPTALFTIGEILTNEEQNLLLTEFAPEKRNEILIVTINAKLATPLLLYIFESTNEDYSLKRQLVFWFDLISDSKNAFRIFSEKIVRNYYESDLENQLSDLRKQFNLPAKESSKEVSELKTSSKSRESMGDQPSMIGELTRSEVEILLRVLAIFQNNIAKKKDNVIREVGEDLRKHEIKNITDNQINSVALRLVQKEFLKETPTQFRKTPSWSPKDILKSFHLVKE
jgi:hypothetical protein